LIWRTFAPRLPLLQKKYSKAFIIKNLKNISRQGKRNLWISEISPLLPT
jgi:hypothetical protein